MKKFLEGSKFDTPQQFVHRVALIERHFIEIAEDMQKDIEHENALKLEAVKQAAFMGFLDKLGKCEKYSRETTKSHQDYYHVTEQDGREMTAIIIDAFKCDNENDSSINIFLPYKKSLGDFGYVMNVINGELNAIEISVLGVTPGNEEYTANWKSYNMVNAVNLIVDYFSSKNAASYVKNEGTLATKEIEININESPMTVETAKKIVNKCAEVAGHYHEKIAVLNGTYAPKKPFYAITTISQAAAKIVEIRNEIDSLVEVYDRLKDDHEQEQFRKNNESILRETFDLLFI